MYMHVCAYICVYFYISQFMSFLYTCGRVVKNAYAVCMG